MTHKTVTFLRALIALAFAAFIVSALPSCSHAERAGVTGGLYLQHESGSKAGLEFDPSGTATAFARTPIKDPSTGEILGYARIEKVVYEKALDPPVIEAAK